MMRTDEPLLFFIRHSFLYLLHVILWRQVQLVARCDLSCATAGLHASSLQFSNLASEHYFHFDVVDISGVCLDVLIGFIKSFDGLFQFFWRLIDELLIVKDLAESLLAVVLLGPLAILILLNKELLHFFLVLFILVKLSLLLSFKFFFGFGGLLTLHEVVVVHVAAHLIVIFRAIATFAFFLVKLVLAEHDIEFSPISLHLILLVHANSHRFSVGRITTASLPQTRCDREG